MLEFRNTGRCGYYFVNHAEQRLFWLDEYDGMDFLFEVKVEYTPSLVGKLFFYSVARMNYLIHIDDLGRSRNESLVLVGAIYATCTWSVFVNLTHFYWQAS